LLLSQQPTSKRIKPVAKKSALPDQSGEKPIDEFSKVYAKADYYLTGYNGGQNEG
jgi:hypothetical protein